MNILALITAFGGGAFAAAIGGVPAFIFTGILSIIGAVAGMVGAADASGVLVGYMAFGSFFGPHISFAGAVAGAAYAKKKGVLENGADIVTPLVGLNEPDTLLVGGVFGVIGYLFKALVVDNLFAGTISPRLVTDGPGFTVFCSAVLVRLVFGGKLKTGDRLVSEGKAFTNVVVMSLCYSLVVAGIYAWAAQTGVNEAFAGLYHVLIFGLAAVGLLFACMGHAYAGHHHVWIIAAEAAVQSYAHTQNAFVCLICGVICGTIAGIIGDIEGNTINCGTDSHIDNPATAIFIMTFVINAIWPAV